MLKFLLYIFNQNLLEIKEKNYHTSVRITPPLQILCDFIL